MSISNEFDFIVIGKTPTGLMTSINLSHQGFKVLILSSDNFDKYPEYIVSPLSSLKAMNIPYNDTNLSNLIKTKVDYIERTFNISRFQFIKSQPANSESNSKYIDSKMFFDKREFVCININNFINYLTTISKKMNVDIQNIFSYEILATKGQIRVSTSSNTNESFVIKSKMCNIITTSTKTSQDYVHQTIFIPKILTDGLDVFISQNIFPSGYIYVSPTKNGSILNFIGKINSKNNISRELIQIMDSIYGYNIEDDIKKSKNYLFQTLDQNQLVYSNNLFQIGSSLSIAHPLTFGYFSGEIQTGLVFTDAFLESITNNQELDINKIKNEYLKRLSELSFISVINNDAGREFYNLSFEELESLMNLLDFSDLSYVSLLQKFRIRIKIILDKKLRKKKKVLKMIYKSYSISRKWY